MADGLATFDASVTCIKLLIWIIKTSQEVKRFKNYCEAVHSTCTVLLSMLERNKQVLQQDVTATRLAALLKDISRFVHLCTNEYNIIQQAWEVMWRKKLAGMLSDLREWVINVILETSIETRTELAGQSADFKNIEQSIRELKAGLSMSLKESVEEKAEQRAAVEAMLEISRELRAEKTNHSPVSFLTIDFDEGDESLQSSGDVAAGVDSFSGTLNGRGVICYHIELVAGKPTKKASRHLKIYEKITDRTSVHPFYGIAKRANRYWMVMQDLSGSPTIAKFLSDETVELTYHERVKIAYEISKTIAYLHSVGIVVKTISDDNFVLVRVGDHLQPVLLNLYRARLSIAWTDSITYDVRYEAPEYAELREHGFTTDIWSLGLIIWQCLTSRAPFGRRQPIDAREDAEAASEIRRQLNAEFTYPLCNLDVGTAFSAELQSIISACCQKRSTLRPSAVIVAQQLFEHLPFETPFNASRRVLELEDAKKRVFDIFNDGLSDNKLSETQLSTLKMDLVILHGAANKGDPMASFLFGRTIWAGYVDVESSGAADNGQWALTVATALNDERYTKFQRAQATQKYFEFAMQAGINDSALYLKSIHAALGQAYRDIYQNLEA